MVSLVLLAVLAASPLTLAQIEAEVIANNPDLQVTIQQTRVVESRLGTADAFEDPQFGYRAWSTPIFQPWNMNQTQHMFMFTQNPQSMSVEAESAFFDALSEYEQGIAELERAIGSPLPAERKTL